MQPCIAPPRECPVTRIVTSVGGRFEGPAMLSITAWPTKQPLKQHAGNTLQHWHAPGTQQQQKPLKNEQPVTVLPGEGSGWSSESAWGHEAGGGHVDVAAGAPFLHLVRVRVRVRGRVR